MTAAMGNPAVTMDELGRAAGGRALLFADWVRVIGTAARAKGLDVPGYRVRTDAGPDRGAVGTPGMGGVTIIVRTGDRPAIDVALDLVDGLAWANDIGTGHADIAYVRGVLLNASGLAGATRVHPAR